MKYFVLLLCAVTAYAVELQISNNLKETIWVGIVGHNGNAHLDEGGFVLASFQQRSVIAPGNWSGTVWARTMCDYKTKICQTGSCGRKVQCSGATATPPVTLVELRLKAQAAPDQYGVSLIDGFNVPAKIEPLNGRGECFASMCTADVNAKCHEDLSIIGTNGDVVGCQSSCNRYYSPCCRNKNKSALNCTAAWPIESTPYFKESCPEASDYVSADYNKLFLCNSYIYSISFGEKN